MWNELRRDYADRNVSLKRRDEKHKEKGRRSGGKHLSMLDLPPWEGYGELGEACGAIYRS